MADRPIVTPKAAVRRRPRNVHSEQHFNAGDAVRDVIIGMSDGLTVPFALAAGISGAIAASHIVVTAGIAELAAGGISMGLGGYLAARSDVEHYESEQRREYAETEEVKQLVDTVTSNRKSWVDFMMRFELGLEKPDPGKAPLSAMRIGGSYVIGGLIPLLPYMLLSTTREGLIWSAIVTFIALVAFGAVKGRFTGVSIWKSAVQTSLIGAVAAAVAFFLARLVNGSTPA
jgi:VIT1/CCC1 family predicted Fe2+/Mn2+ transporter